MMHTLVLPEDILIKSDSLLKNRHGDKYYNSVKQLVNASNTYNVCKLLNTEFVTIQQELLNPNYIEFEIPKKGKKVRKIQAPSSELKGIQERLNYLLQVYYFYWLKPKFVHGFIIRPRGEMKTCSIVSNAQVHIGKKYVLNIDLKDFFSSISTRMVYDLFRSNLFNYPDNIAKTFTLLCTYKGHLPTGAPTSPVLSNFICLNMDNALKSYCDSQNVRISRYADDLTFSSDIEFTPTFISEISSLISDYKLQVNPQKIYCKKNHRKQLVTGVVVNTKVNIDRKMLKKIRAMLHTWKTKGLDHAVNIHYKKTKKLPSNPKTHFVNQLGGYINFIGQIRGKQDALYQKNRALYKELILNSQNDGD
jgi:RNA-directed DNA polymerase